MASLVKQHSSYYTQFYDPSRIPSRKRVALKTKFKDLALRKHVELEKAYELGEFDPWIKQQKPKQPLSRNSRLGDVITYYITQKSREDWRDRTACDTTYVLRAFERVTGSEKPISCLCATDFNDYKTERVLPLQRVTVTAPSLNPLLSGASRISYFV